MFRLQGVKYFSTKFCRVYMYWIFAAKPRSRTRKLVPDSNMLTELDAYDHLSVVLKCIMHAPSYLRISDSLSLVYIEQLHKVWLMYAECDLNVTGAPSVGRS